MKSKTKEKLIRDIYYEVGKPGSFGGLESLWREVHNKSSKVTKSDVLEWLKKQDSYTIHKPFNSKLPSRRVVVPHLNYLWQADLLDMKNISNENDGVKYLLTCIDVFSKLAWIIPLKSKTAAEVLEAVKSITTKTKPIHLQTDQGTEFFNKYMREYLKAQNINIYATKSAKKASIVERFNRTFRDKIERYFTFTNSKRYIDILEKFVRGYNNSYHRSIKTKPTSVTLKNSPTVFKNMYGYDMNEGPDDIIEKFNFKVKDKVRIVKFKSLFSKGSSPNWTREIFKIEKVYPTIPPSYSIIDLNGDLILGEFYEHELQKIEKDDEIYQVEEILKSTGKKPNRKYLVKWLGYPASFNSWIDEKDYDL